MGIRTSSEYDGRSHEYGKYADVTDGNGQERVQVELGL